MAFLRPVFPASRVQYIFRPAFYIRTWATSCGSMVDIQSVAAEIR